MMPESRDAALLALTLAEAHSDPSILAPRVTDATLAPEGSWAEVAEAAAAWILELVAATREQVDDDARSDWYHIAHDLSGALGRMVDHAAGFAGPAPGSEQLYEGMFNAVTGDSQGFPSPFVP